nr:restriction endonuclease subunit S [uncultured Lachnoanaerobaculum sp.]
MSRVPRIRFKGFEEDWEQRKLGEVFEEYSEKNHSELPPLTIIQGGGTIRRDESDRAVQYDMNSLSNYKMVNKDDFIVHLRSFEGGLEKANSKGIISPAYHTFSGENTDTTFYYTYFRSEKFIESDLKPHVYGIRDGRSIDVEGMKSINIPYTIFEEQRHIGYLIDSINHLITLHQRKLEKLKIIKKSMLENLFPQNGEKTPKIRFSGFTNDWEQRKFGELFLEKRDKTEREDEDVLLSCAITGIYLNSELFSHFRGTSNIGYLKIKKNDLILSAQNLHLGNANVNLLFEHGIISPAYKVYELNKCDQYFVQSWVKKDSTKDFFLDATTEGASQCRKNIDWRILNNQLIAIPSLYEQIRIGKLLHCLNHLITLHQSKLEKLQKIKKSMLESMFV